MTNTQPAGDQLTTRDMILLALSGIALVVIIWSIAVPIINGATLLATVTIIICIAKIWHTPEAGDRR